MSVSSTFRTYGERPYSTDTGGYGVSTAAVSTLLFAQLPAGAYQLYNDHSEVLVLRVGAAIASLKPAARTGGQFALPPRGACNLVLGAAADLYGQTASGAGSLYVNNPAAGT